MVATLPANPHGNPPWNTSVRLGMAKWPIVGSSISKATVGRGEVGRRRKKTQISHPARPFKMKAPSQFNLFFFFKSTYCSPYFNLKEAEKLLKFNFYLTQSLVFTASSSSFQQQPAAVLKWSSDKHILPFLEAYSKQHQSNIDRILVRYSLR